MVFFVDWAGWYVITFFFFFFLSFFPSFVSSSLIPLLLPFLSAAGLLRQTQAKTNVLLFSLDKNYN